MPDDLRAAAERIEANPLGRIMYGNRELFHSNLLAWFFEVLPEAADAVFRPLTEPGEDRGRFIEREHRNLDLVMHWPDRAPLVVENKVFSVPGRAQLDDYAADVSTWPSPPSLVLLSAGRPPFDPAPWQHLDYAALAVRIGKALPNSSTYEVETMCRYATLCGDLHALLSATEVATDDETVWLPEHLLAPISSSQMRAALQKARAARIARTLNDALDLQDPAKGDMSRATPLVEVLESVQVGGMALKLGWQFQGNQFRRAVVFEDPAVQGHDAASRDVREGLARANPEFFELPEHLGGAGGRREFNHFAPSFVYRYVKVPGLTIRQLLELARDIHESVRALAGSESPHQ